MIHYHGSPLGGPASELSKFYSRRHGMVSFANPQDIAVVAECCQSFALDNGAYTAWKGGDRVDVDKYLEWVDIWDKHPAFDWALIPDVIDGDESENDQMIRMCRDSKDTMVPIWHLNESLNKLGKLTREWPIVAFGSSGEYGNPGSEVWHKRMDVAMVIACDSKQRPVTKFHGLRMLDPMIVQRYPLSSADSTTAVRNSAYEVKFGAYPHPNRWGRASVVADIIESVQSPPTYDKDHQFELKFALNY